MPQPNLGFIPLAKHKTAVKFLPSYICKSPSGSVSDRQLVTLCVRSTEPGCLLQSDKVSQHSHVTLKGVSKSPHFDIHYGNFIQ